MKRFLILSTALTALAGSFGCNCLRGRGAACAPACMPAAACAPAMGYSDCGPAASYGGGTIVEQPYLGSPTPAGTVVTPQPMTYTPAPN